MSSASRSLAHKSMRRVSDLRLTCMRTACLTCDFVNNFFTFSPVTTIYREKKRLAIRRVCYESYLVLSGSVCLGVGREKLLEVRVLLFGEAEVARFGL